MKNKERILIVDDEKINLDFFDVMLSKLGFRVTTAENGEDALAQVREETPDLIILDNIMPRMNGWEVTRLLKTDPEWADYRDIPIMMFSAMQDVQDKIEGFELGIEDYITKPFNFSEVFARIKAVLRQRDLARQLIQRERRLVLIESLNNSLVYFTNHLREPLQGLRETAEQLNVDDPEAVGRFCTRLTQEVHNTMAALDALHEEIDELAGEDSRMKANEVTLEVLEQKYQEHVSSLARTERELAGED
ncbi:response regulator transcription factor [Spirochaeta africana]|uniref:Response regulator with CheY-like receiver domain and winged-helix DNA-binding domain n=1 Tax=Spirochaeta africana (strain ATCC 700263 / DSM 8902 / Z-7692) TaxID=889378 RepID=H9UKE9_SPIAZ|nr:response regulator [Spirochaeta africana]AFG37992.1 response regulator with CheY-like receiver domain and winged-helix DNA-binding domain [Spirochaeta africana DSM 8902]